MTNTIHDVAIIGAGVVGAAIARLLSRYQLSVALLEKEADVGFGVSKANSGIIHAGFHYDAAKTLKGKLEIQGNLAFDRLKLELGFPFKRCGIIMAAFNDEELATIRTLIDRGIGNGVPGIQECSREEILELEPDFNPEVIGGLLAPTGGVIEPYRYVFALTEAALRNGVEIFKLFKVTRADREDAAWCITAADGQTLRARYVINAAGLFADEISRLFGAEEFTITPRKGEEYLLDRNTEVHPTHVLFPTPSAHSKGILVIPTAEGTTMIGPTAEMTDDKEDADTTADNFRRIFAGVTHMMPGLCRRDVITAFSGSRPVLPGEDFYITVSQKMPHLIQVAGILSPGLTASPAIAEYVRDLLKQDGLELTEKTVWHKPDAPLPTVRKLKPEQVDELYHNDPAWCNIICRCESISEAEIVNAIRHGHTTIDGIKFFTRAGMGRCQGGFCSYKIMKLIARETGLPIEKISKHGPGSEIVVGHLHPMPEPEAQNHV